MAELESNTHLHYIRAIKNGSIKVINVVPKGKLGLKFRQLVDIYAKADEPIPRIQQQVVVRESEDFNVTLETIRKQCKEKKRKRKEEVQREKKIMTHRNEDKRCDDLEEDEEEEQPLCNWDTKFSKRRKKKAKTKSVPTSPSPSVKEACFTLCCDVKREPCEDSCLVSDAIEPEERRLTLYCSPQPISPVTVATRETQCCLAADNIGLESKENGLHSSVSSREETELEIPQNNSGSAIIIYVPPSSKCEEVQEEDSMHSLSMNLTGLTIVKTETPKILAHDVGVEKTEIVKLEAPEALASVCSDLPTMDSAVQNTEITPEILAIDNSTVEDKRQSIFYKAFVKVTTTEAKTDIIELHNQPEKLLSGRKALSPTSQANLRKAMEYPESPKKKIKTQGKLYFSSQSSRRILKAEGIEVVPNSKQPIQKANLTQNRRAERKKLSRRRRDKTRAPETKPFSSACTSLQECSQEAVSFTQGQMSEFHRFAAKLTEEIESMKEVTKSCLLGVDSKIDEVKSMIKNVERIEKSSKKWISTTEHDCDRFCKVMGMVREDSSPVVGGIVVHEEKKKKKKVRFADYEGGELCHVKVFKIDSVSES